MAGFALAIIVARCDAGGGDLADTARIAKHPWAAGKLAAIASRFGTGPVDKALAIGAASLSLGGTGGLSFAGPGRRRGKSGLAFLAVTTPEQHGAQEDDSTNRIY